MCLGCKHKPRKISHFPALPDVRLIWCLRPGDGGTTEKAKKKNTYRISYQIPYKVFLVWGNWWSSQLHWGGADWQRVTTKQEVNKRT